MERMKSQHPTVWHSMIEKAAKTAATSDRGLARPIAEIARNTGVVEIAES